MLHMHLHTLLQDTRMIKSFGTVCNCFSLLPQLLSTNWEGKQIMQAIFAVFACKKLVHDLKWIKILSISLWKTDYTESLSNCNKADDGNILHQMATIAFIYTPWGSYGHFNEVNHMWMISRLAEITKKNCCASQVGLIGISSAIHRQSATWCLGVYIRILVVTQHCWHKACCDKFWGAILDVSCQWFVSKRFGGRRTWFHVYTMYTSSKTMHVNHFQHVWHMGWY